MSRTLPLSSADQPRDQSAPSDAGSATAPSPASPATIQVFDPPMCCPTGLCGPGVDPSLLQIARDLRWLGAQGVRVERFGLSQEPQAFVANPRIASLMQTMGDRALPAVVLNDRLVAHGRYPTREELVTALAAATAPGTRAESSFGETGER